MYTCNFGVIVTSSNHKVSRVHKLQRNIKRNALGRLLKVLYSKKDYIKTINDYNYEEFSGCRQYADLHVLAAQYTTHLDMFAIHPCQHSSLKFKPRASGAT